MMGKRELVEQYKSCINISNLLQSELGKLSGLASKFLGFNVEANICTGNEIEFRKISEDDGYVDSSSVIFLEDFETLKKIEL